MYKHEFEDIDTRTRVDIGIYRNDYSFVVAPYPWFGVISKEYVILVYDDDCVIMKKKKILFKMGLFKMLIKGTKW